MIFTDIGQFACEYHTMIVHGNLMTSFSVYFLNFCVAKLNYLFHPAVRTDRLYVVFIIKCQLGRDLILWLCRSHFCLEL